MNDRHETESTDNQRADPKARPRAAGRAPNSCPVRAKQTDRHMERGARRAGMERESSVSEAASAWRLRTLAKHSISRLFLRLHPSATTCCPGAGPPKPLHTTTQREARRSNRLVVRCARKPTTAAGGAAWRGRGVRCAVPSARRVAGVDACVPASAARPIGRKIRRPEGGDRDRRPPPLRLRIGAYYTPSCPRRFHRVAAGPGPGKLEAGHVLTGAAILVACPSAPARWCMPSLAAHPCSCLTLLFPGRLRVPQCRNGESIGGRLAISVARVT